MAKKSFQPTMCTMKAPEGMGNASVEGIELEQDEKGCIQVPEAIAKRLEPHGFKHITQQEYDAIGAEPEPAAPKKKVGR